VGVSYFGDDPHRKFPEADYVHRGKGGKWDGLFDFFRMFPETVDAYDYFWLPDDDILATADAISDLFETGAAKGFHVFQPALDDRSYYSHLITLEHPSFDLRFTNFVEVMVPVISREVLVKTLPFLETTRSGFGIDFLWPQLVKDITGETFKGVAILDSICVRHTRPVGGSLHQFMARRGGRSAMDEMHDTVRRVKERRTTSINGVAVPRIRILSGINKGGRYLRGMQLALHVAGDLLHRHVNLAQPVAPMAALRHAIKAAM
jgi:hypothetical protein